MSGNHMEVDMDMQNHINIRTKNVVKNGVATKNKKSKKSSVRKKQKIRSGCTPDRVTTTGVTMQA